MNDLWTYHAASQQWREVPTSGDRPAQRSNCSMNYDPLNNQLVLFGGGGPNKQRFNCVSVLDWATKNWVEIPPKENEPKWTGAFKVGAGLTSGNSERRNVGASFDWFFRQ